MERVFRLTTPLACLHEKDDLPKGTLAMEPRNVGDDLVFLASTDQGETWREYVTIIEDPAADWFRPVEQQSDLS